MTKQKARRLLAKESKWTCGNGVQGRNKGKGRKTKKARAHAQRLRKLEERSR